MALAVVNAMVGQYDFSASWLKKLIALEPENATYDADITCLNSAKNKKKGAVY